MIISHRAMILGKTKNYVFNISKEAIL